MLQRLPLFPLLPFLKMYARECLRLLPGSFVVAVFFLLTPHLSPLLAHWGNLDLVSVIFF